MTDLAIVTCQLNSQAARAVSAWISGQCQTARDPVQVLTALTSNVAETSAIRDGYAKMMQEARELAEVCGQQAMLAPSVEQVL